MYVLKVYSLLPKQIVVGKSTSTPYICVIYAVIQIHSSPILSRRPLVTQRQPDVEMFFNFIIMSPHLTLTAAIMIRDSINQGCHPYRITLVNATIVYLGSFLLFIWNFVFVLLERWRWINLTLLIIIMNNSSVCRAL